VISKKKLIIPKVTNKINSNLLRELNIGFSQKFLNHKPAKKLEVRDKSYDPVFKELFFLHNLVTLNRRLTILEFGSGWSSLFLYHALKKNKKKYENQTRTLRGNNKFEIFVLENEKKYLNISRNRVNKFNKYLKIKKPIKITYCYSEVEMTLFNNRIATQYKKLPLCNHDFIYLDGPGQFNIKKDVNGISTRHNDMMPMVCDILKFEYFFTPGSIIVCDGRAANAKFLKDNFKRKWKYVDDKKNDQHIFWLDDPTLGKYNKLQIDFYKK